MYRPVVGSLLLASACGLSVVGTMPGDGDGGPGPDGSAPDGAIADGSAAPDGPPVSTSDGQVQPPVVGVKCGTVVCKSEPCRSCPSEPAECKKGIPSCDGKLYLECDDAADCADGERCCAAVDTLSSVTAECKPTCAGNEDVLCDPLVSAPCPTGGTCVPSTKAALAGRFACK